ncbi:hypothetical protein J6590_016481 [Homalodisca vitripennis]|nr:hypothetical protein J6590_016481 [Homalodisca vitripennis]
MSVQDTVSEDQWWIRLQLRSVPGNHRDDRSSGPALVPEVLVMSDLNAGVVAAATRNTRLQLQPLLHRLSPLSRLSMVITLIWQLQNIDFFGPGSRLSIVPHRTPGLFVPCQDQQAAFVLGARGGGDSDSDTSCVFPESIARSDQSDVIMAYLSRSQVVGEVVSPTVVPLLSGNTSDVIMSYLSRSQVVGEVVPLTAYIDHLTISIIRLTSFRY